MVERITPIDSNNLQYEATVDDPKVYTRPWTIRYFYSRILDPKFEHLEFACIEGEVDQSKHCQGWGPLYLERLQRSNAAAVRMSAPAMLQRERPSHGLRLER